MEERYHATTQNRFYPDMSNVNKNITVEAKRICPPTYVAVKEGKPDHPATLYSYTKPHCFEELRAGHEEQRICISQYPVLFTLAAKVEPSIITKENAIQSVSSVGISDDTNAADKHRSFITFFIPVVFLKLTTLERMYLSNTILFDGRCM